MRNIKRTASHIMLFVILIVYFIVAAVGVFAGIYCFLNELTECGTQILIGLFSYTAVCGSSTIIVYTNKATKENELKISGGKYRLRLELAKEIFAENGETLDDKSIELLKRLMSDNTENYPADDTQNGIPHEDNGNIGGVG